MVVVTILILHFLLKNYLLDHKLLYATTDPPITVASSEANVPVPVASIAKAEKSETTVSVNLSSQSQSPLAPANEMFESGPKDDPKSLDNLFKYILETSPPPPVAAVPLSQQPSNSDPLAFADQHMFSNIVPFEDDTDSPLYEEVTWK